MKKDISQKANIKFDQKCLEQAKTSGNVFKGVRKTNKAQPQTENDSVTQKEKTFSGHNNDQS